jgi:hypothetical protein
MHLSIDAPLFAPDNQRPKGTVPRDKPREMGFKADSSTNACTQDSAHSCCETI